LRGKSVSEALHLFNLSNLARLVVDHPSGAPEFFGKVADFCKRVAIRNFGN